MSSVVAGREYAAATPGLLQAVGYSQRFKYLQVSLAILVAALPPVFLWV